MGDDVEVPEDQRKQLMDAEVNGIARLERAIAKAKSQENGSNRVHADEDASSLEYAIAKAKLLVHGSTHEAYVQGINEGYTQFMRAQEGNGSKHFMCTQQGDIREKAVAKAELIANESAEFMRAQQGSPLDHAISKANDISQENAIKGLICANDDVSLKQAMSTTLAQENEEENLFENTIELTRVEEEAVAQAIAEAKAKIEANDAIGQAFAKAKINEEISQEDAEGMRLTAGQMGSLVRTIQDMQIETLQVCTWNLSDHLLDASAPKPVHKHQQVQPGITPTWGITPEMSPLHTPRFSSSPPVPNSNRSSRCRKPESTCRILETAITHGSMTAEYSKPLSSVASFGDGAPQVTQLQNRQAIAPVKFMSPRSVPSTPTVQHRIIPVPKMSSGSVSQSISSISSAHPVSPMSLARNLSTPKDIADQLASDGPSSRSTYLQPQEVKQRIVVSPINVQRPLAHINERLFSSAVQLQATSATWRYQSPASSSREEVQVQTTHCHQSPAASPREEVRLQTAWLHQSLASSPKEEVQLQTAQRFKSPTASPREEVQQNTKITYSPIASYVSSEAQTPKHTPKLSSREVIAVQSHNVTPKLYSREVVSPRQLTSPRAVASTLQASVQPQAAWQYHQPMHSPAASPREKFQPETAQRCQLPANGVCRSPCMTARRCRSSHQTNGQGICQSPLTAARRCQSPPTNNGVCPSPIMTTRSTKAGASVSQIMAPTQAMYGVAMYPAISSQCTMTASKSQTGPFVAQPSGYPQRLVTSDLTRGMPARSPVAMTSSQRTLGIAAQQSNYGSKPVATPRSTDNVPKFVRTHSTNPALPRFVPGLVHSTLSDITVEL